MKRALILAAGRGTRLGELTLTRPKPMLPLGGVPMLERIMRSIAEETGIRDFVLVTGYLSSVVEEHFGDGARFGWTVDFVEQKEARGVGDAVDVAASALRGEPFLMTYGDIMLDPANYGAIAAQWDRLSGCAAIVGLNWVEDPWRGAAVYVDSEERVLRIEEKPPRGTAATHWNNAGLFVFDPVLFTYTARLTPSARGERELPDAISTMIGDGHRVATYHLTGDWRDVGTPEDYREIDEQFAGKPA